MTSLLRDVVKQSWLAVDVVYYNVGFSVAIEIRYGQAATGPAIHQPAAGCGGNAHKFAVGGVSKQQDLLGITGSPLIFIDRRINMTVCDDQVLPTVVIEIQKTCTPPQERNRYRRLE